MEFLHPEDRDLAMRTVEGALKSGEPYSVYYRILQRGGEERIVHSIGSVVSDEFGTPIRMFGATQDVTERKRAEEELKATSEQLRALSTRLQSAREEEARRMLAVQETERQHLARELHDEIGQLLTSLRLLLKPEGEESPDAVKTRFERSRAMVDDLLGKVRELSFDLRPADLDQLGLLPALLTFSGRFSEQTGLLVDFKHTGIEGRFAPEVETAAYRIVQEALTNVARHAGVAGAILRVWGDASMLNLKIEDRGRGFDADATLKAPRTSGLRGMQERAMLLGGRMTIESSPGSGTTIAAELPLSSTGSGRPIDS